jgi:hypothetical protein
MATLALEGTGRLRLADARAVPRSVQLTPVLLFFLAVVMPSELAINVAGLALIPVRIVLLFFFLPAVLRLASARELRLQAFDWLLALAFLWLLMALVVNNGAERGFKFGGSLLLESLGGYLLARAYVRSYAQFAFAVRTYFAFVMVAAAIAVPETFFRIQFVHDLAASISGLPKAVIGSEAGRLGLARANSSFDHPILYGVFCASSVGLVWYLYSGRPVRWVKALAIAAATLCAVSSAPLLAYFMIVGFIVWEAWTRTIGPRVAITLGLVLAFFLMAEVASNRTAIEVFIGMVALDAWTAYYRVLIYTNASIDLVNSPWFGVALNKWTRPSWMTGSVDSFWLNIALMGGLPAVTMMAGAMLLLLVSVHRRRAAGETRERWQARFGWTATMLAFWLQAFTVHYWGAMNSLFFFLLGVGAWLTDSSRGLQPGVTLDGHRQQLGERYVRRLTPTERKRSDLLAPNGPAPALCRRPPVMVGRRG